MSAIVPVTNENVKKSLDFIDIPTVETAIDTLKQSISLLEKHYKLFCMSKKNCQLRIQKLQTQSASTTSKYEFERNSFGEICLKLNEEQMKILEKDPFDCVVLSLTTKRMQELQQRLNDNEQKIALQTQESQTYTRQLCSLGSAKQRQNLLNNMELIPSDLLTIITDYDKSSAYEPMQSIASAKRKFFMT